MTTAPDTATTPSYILPELMQPTPQANGLDTPYWEGTQQERLVVQRCRSCRSWQWGPEWMCYACQSFDVGWQEVPKAGDRYRGNIYSWERVWHATDDGLAAAIPYVVLIVELPDAANIRMVGNLVGDQRADVHIGSEVSAAFEHHVDFALVQWE